MSRIRACVSRLPPRFSRFSMPIRSRTGLTIGRAQRPSRVRVSPNLFSPIPCLSCSYRFDKRSARSSHYAKTECVLSVSHTPSFTSSRVLSSLTQSVNNTSTYTLGLTQQLTTKSSNELRIGYSRADSEANLTLDSFGGGVPIDLAGAMGLDGYPSTNELFQFSFSSIGNSP